MSSSEVNKFEETGMQVSVSETEAIDDDVFESQVDPL